MIFEKLEVTVNSSDVEDCYWLPSNGNKKFIIKLYKREDADKIRRVKRGTLAQVFPCEFCEILKNTFFHRTPSMADSVEAASVSLYTLKIY